MDKLSVKACEDEPFDGRGGPKEEVLRPPAAFALPLASAHLHLLRRRLSAARHRHLPARESTFLTHPPL
ncbi:hypothetical protein AVEN_173775-1 [Araneus ventricosus]|uniref:Uncharacterized protein n=1 Tax=Araneus ventricosus TaxID=182803 RepID=A0A4Y2THJ1_ARAVE|nr:hypothetical protein AVEN_161976-1 [Araneus ventricosus]GBO00105.1 hypothetical protein AVEN_173775-1 [Araneus ventricosus]